MTRPVVIALALLGSSAPALGQDAAIEAHDAISAAWPDRSGHFVVLDVDLAETRTATLTLETFEITTPETQFVIVGAGGERPLDFDSSRVRLARGSVAGAPDSAVFLANYDGRVSGSVDVGGTTYAIGSSDHDPVAGAGAPPTLCACGEQIDGRVHGHAAAGPAQPPPQNRFLHHRRMEMAVETDFEYFSLFGNADDAAAYQVQMWAAVSEIYRDQLNTSVDLVFVRLWETPDDLFNEPNPLGEFRDYWNENMELLRRDVAQFVSGRRDMGFGGIAYLNAVCTENGYGVIAYVGGSFPESDSPNPYNYDVRVAAHELGHNAGTSHTHNYGVDTCDDLNAPPSRGTIMSYCSQTVSGGNSNTELRFHLAAREAMYGYLSSTVCMAIDCNENGVPDMDDILNGDAVDVNGDGVPDSCQDCNGNGTLDPDEIGTDFTLDINMNGLLDECETDCNGNGVSDSLDIMFGDSFDENGNSLPDECDPDCDNDGTADHVQIAADMPIDVNRNLVLDACEDCDGDGTLDLDDLEGAHGVWIATHDPDGRVHELHPTVGTVVRRAPEASVAEGNDVVITPGGRILVSSGDDDRIVEFDRTGAVIGDFVTAGAGGLVQPGEMLLRDDGSVLVASTGSDEVLVFDANGVFVETLVSAGSGGLVGPFGLEMLPNGDLLVGSSDGSVLRYDGTTGASLGHFVIGPGNGGLTDPRGLLYLPDGKLIVASRGSNEILAYDDTGAFIGKFNQGGTEDALTMDEPWGLELGPDGLVYVSRHGVHEEPGEPQFVDVDFLHINASRIYIFEPRTGIFLRSHSLGNDTDVWEPTGFAFYPGAATDCNFNQIPDDCDIAAGRSLDENGNGVPDECEDGCMGDITGDGVADVDDLLAVLAQWGPCWPALPCDADVNGDLHVDVDDLLLVLSVWGGCG